MHKAIRSPEDFSVFLRAARKERELTQMDLARLTRIKQQTISEIESGRRVVSLRHLFNILSALGLEVAVRERTRRAGGYVPGEAP